MVLERENIALLRGMHVNEGERGAGLAKMFLATWLYLCYEKFGMFRVATRKIDKPVLAMLLQKFYFVSPHGRKLSDGKTKAFACACKKGGWLEIEVDRGQQQRELAAEEAGSGGAGCGAGASDYKGIRVWAADQGKLHTVFSKAFQKTQSIEFLSDKPARSTTVLVETCFFLPRDDCAKEENGSTEDVARREARSLVRQGGIELYSPGHESMRCPLSLFELLNRGPNLKVKDVIPTRVWY